VVPSGCAARVQYFIILEPGLKSARFLEYAGNKCQANQCLLLTKEAAPCGA